MPSVALVRIGALLTVLFCVHSPVIAASLPDRSTGACRNQPGDPSFPSEDQWSALNASVDGRLVVTEPTAKVCIHLNCTDAQWASSVLRSNLPGSMDTGNWEQDYSGEGSLCVRNGDTCGQGSVPLFAVNATTPAHLQAGIMFAAKNNLRVSIKASGHDLLGRSTAKNSLLLWTRQFQEITFSDHFHVGIQDVGSTVTVGSGVGLGDLYAAAKNQNKFFVGGSSGTVAAAGGFSQGAGHSAFSPLLGLATDNAIEYKIVVANGDFLTVNEVSEPDLFWALRGGGSGSWGVITSVTYRTYDIFQATIHMTTVETASLDQTGALMATHARHIFDLDDLRAGQYFYLSATVAGSSLSLSTLVKNISGADLSARMQPFLDDARALGATVKPEVTVTATPNEVIANHQTFLGNEEVQSNLPPPGMVVPFPDDPAGGNLIIGSRLFPAATYRNDPDLFGTTILNLINNGVTLILGNMVAGGKVAENANVSSAVTSKWRTAKTHIFISQTWSDTTPPAVVEQLRQNFTSLSMPILIGGTGETDSGAYSGEADVLEPNFQTTFFGPNYARLSSIKAQYDPDDLFIVGAGVGSERWDAEGMCRL